MIAIKNVKIPDGGCLFCPFEYGFDCRNRESIRKSARGDGRPDWCPLIDLPDGLYQVYYYHKQTSDLLMDVEVGCISVRGNSRDYR